jgi:nucleotide-binding universal stress UspA family protein
MIKIKRVLVPIDFSEFSDRALNYAKEICEKFDAELHLLHVLEVIVSTPQFTMGLAIPAREEESEKLVLEKMAELPGENWAADRAVVRHTAHGAPFVQIVKYAKENDIDILIIGTHGRTGLSHVFMGSVAENVVRQSPCPVLVVRNEGHQFVAP